MGHFMLTKHQEHIVSGDLRIIKSNVLRKLFTKGPKFRESKRINFDKAKSCILTSLEECIQKRCKQKLFLRGPIASLLK